MPGRHSSHRSRLYQRTFPVGRIQTSMIAAPVLQGVEVQINDGRDVKSERLGKQQTSDDSDAERAPDLATGTAAEGNRQGSEKCSHRGHHDRAKPLQAA